MKEPEKVAVDIVCSSVSEVPMVTAIADKDGNHVTVRLSDHAVKVITNGYLRNRVNHVSDAQAEVRAAEDRLAQARRKAAHACEVAVQSGEYANKGAARRAMGLDDPVPGVDVSAQIGKEWYDRIAKGMAHARPTLPNIAESMTTVVNNMNVVKRPWWKFWGK